MDIARFNSQGGPLLVEVICGFAQPGSYELRLYETNSNRLVVWPDGQLKPTGNFINTEDDRYDLPHPVGVNSGRLVECFIAIEIAPPLNDYVLALEVIQDGQRLARDEKQGTAMVNFTTIIADLFIQLIPQA